MKIKKAPGEILNWSKMKQDTESPKTNSEPATPAFVRDTIACTPKNKPDDVLSSRILATPTVSKCFAPKNEESISIIKTKSNLFLYGFCLLCVRARDSFVKTVWSNIGSL